MDFREIPEDIIYLFGEWLEGDDYLSFRLVNKRISGILTKWIDEYVYLKLRQEEGPYWYSSKDVVQKIKRSTFCYAVENLPLGTSDFRAFRTSKLV